MEKFNKRVCELKLAGVSNPAEDPVAVELYGNLIMALRAFAEGKPLDHSHCDGGDKQ